MSTKKKPAREDDPWSLLETWRRVECIIVESERDKGLVSIRTTQVKPHEGGKATTLKARLTEAGFKPGDLVMIVPLKPRGKRVPK